MQWRVAANENRTKKHTHELNTTKERRSEEKNVWFHHKSLLAVIKALFITQKVKLSRFGYESSNNNPRTITRARKFK